MSGKQVVKNLNINQNVICATFNADEIPEDGGFKGYASDYKIIELVNETSVKLQSIKDENKVIVFNFREDIPNMFYKSKDKNWYTGIFTNIQILFTQYMDLVKNIRGNNSEQKEPEDV